MTISKGLVLEPMVSTKPSETHATLVVSQEEFSNISFGADFSTMSQLRTGSAPNAWESAWAVFNYTDNTHFYYVAFKPNGWELGKADPAYPGAQRFLASGNTPASGIGEEHRFDIKTNGNTITVTLDGEILTTFTDHERPYLSGKLGFYTEDAKVVFDNVSGDIVESFDSYTPQSFQDGAKIGSRWEVPFTGFGTVEVASAGATPVDSAPVDSAPGNVEFGGTANNDYILANDLNNTVQGYAGSDNLNAMGGDDVIVGGAGADAMAGGYGTDRFDFNAISELQGDRIVDWYNDVLDFSTIDANSAASGNNVFSFIGTRHFTQAGQLHAVYDAARDVTYVEGNVDRDMTADFRLELQGFQNLTAGQLIL